MIAVLLKGYTNQKDQPNKETRGTRSEREHRASISSPEESGYVTFSAHQCIYQPASSTELQCSAFLLGFYYIGLID